MLATGSLLFLGAMLSAATPWRGLSGAMAMITTFFGQDGLGSNAAFVLSLLLGFGFGFALEQPASAVRAARGIFYFRDMTVLRVMFTAMVTACLVCNWRSHWA